MAGVTDVQDMAGNVGEGCGVAGVNTYGHSGRARVILCSRVDAMAVNQKKTPLDRAAKARAAAVVSGWVLLAIIVGTFVAAAVQPAEQWMTAFVIVMSGLGVAVVALIVWVALFAHAKSVERAERHKVETEPDQATLAEVAKLDGLRQSGYLTTEEFEAAMSRLLGGWLQLGESDETAKFALEGENHRCDADV
jgi:hypothetical protein